MQRRALQIRRRRCRPRSTLLLLLRPDATSATTLAHPRALDHTTAHRIANIDVSSGSTTLSTLRNATVDLITELAERNPTPAPFAGWRGGGGSKLSGRWKLLFTTGADATFRPSKDKGSASTYQEIDGDKGYFVNCVDFVRCHPPAPTRLRPHACAQQQRTRASSPCHHGPQDNADSKLQGFRVVVKGKALSDTEVQLYFRRVKLLRRSRWLKRLVIPLPPSWFLRALARRASRGKAQLSDRGAGFTMLYLDDDLRMHKTFDGQFFVQQRIP
jgi:hypothetical protein